MKNKNTISIFYKLFFIAAIFFAVFVLAELGNKFWAVGAAGIVVLIAAYLYLSQREKEKQEEKTERELEKRELHEKLDELLNVEKAVYTAVKRGNDKIEKQIASVGGEGDAKGQETLLRIAAAQEQMISESKRLTEIQVNALKTVAKYNKENARQLALNINENAEKLGEKLQNGLTALQGGIAGAAVQAVRNAEEHDQSVPEAGLEETVETISVLEPEIVPEPEVSLEPESMSEVEPILGNVSEIISEVDSEPAAEAISVPIPDPEPTPEVVPEVSEPVAEPPAPSMPVMDDPNRAMSPDEIAALIASMGGGSDPVPDPTPEPEPVSEAISVPIPDPEPMPEVVPEVSEPSAPSMPVMDDPNRAMSPDEIAALIASMGK